MTAMLRDLIAIPTSVSEGDFVIRTTERADLDNYVVTDQLRDSFAEALRTVGHAVTTGRSQAKFLHGSFGSGKSHFMAVLREILAHNPQARSIRGLAEPIGEADAWLQGRRVLSLSFHMLDADSVEQAVLEGYFRQVTALHPDAPAPAVHRSDALLDDAKKLRAKMGDETFFAELGGENSGSGTGTAPGEGLAALAARSRGWTAEAFESAAKASPGTSERDRLVSALTATFYTNAVRSGEYLDLDTGLQVITRHAKSLGYDVMVLFLDELILWLSTKLAEPTFVNTEGAKLNKLVESSDAARPLPLVSFVARQRNLEEFLGPQIGGTEREALAHVMRSVQGRLGEIVLADTNLPVITEKRLLRPVSDEAHQAIDDAFAAVRSHRDVWDTLLLGDQYGDAGIGSDATAFRRLYPFSPALVATLVALSQALQRERTALRVMTELLVARRDTLRVNDLIGVSALFEPLVLHGELPDRPQLRQQFQAARDTYLQKLRPLLLERNSISEEQAAGHEQFQLDDKLLKTLLLGALVPDVPALHNLTASRLHALNFGSITSPIPGYENQIVIDRLTRIANDAGELQKSEGTDPVFVVKLSSIDYEKLLDLVPQPEIAAGVLQQVIRTLVSAELGLESSDGTVGELPYLRDWRGRRHHIAVKFGNLRNRDALPDSDVYATGDTWKIIIDYPFDEHGRQRRDDFARIEELERGSRTVFWLPYFFTQEVISRVSQLAKINYLLGSDGTRDRLATLAIDWPPTERQQGKAYLQGRQQQLRNSLLEAIKQAYGVVRGQAEEVEGESTPVLHTLAEGLPLGDPRGGTLPSAFENLTADLLRWSYPATPALPEDEKPVTKAELGKILRYAQEATTDPTHGVNVEQPDRRAIQRVCNPLRLGELAEHRYVLTSVTCWWSQHLLQGAAQKGYTEHFPVRMLRELLDLPAPRGFDTDLQNLILAVFALEQDLAWYQHGGKVKIAAVQAVSDQMELRHPPMPDEATWRRAVTRVKPLFGKSVSEWRSPATVAELASAARAVAKEHLAAADALVAELTGHAVLLGLDLEGRSGRLATARRVAKLLRAIAGETDDVVVVGQVAEAEVGDVDDAVAGASLKQAVAVAGALTAANWQLLTAVETMSGRDKRADLILGDLHSIANSDQHAADLGAALTQAVIAATALLAEQAAPAPPEIDLSVAVPGGPQEASVRVVESMEATPAATPTSTTAVSLDVSDEAALHKVVSDIERSLAHGRRVRLTWEEL